MPIKVHKASEFLQTPEDIAAYLNATIEEMDDPRLLMKAFRNIAEAQGWCVRAFAARESRSCRAVAGVVRSEASAP